MSSESSPRNASGGFNSEFIRASLDEKHRIPIIKLSQAGFDYRDGGADMSCHLVVADVQLGGSDNRTVDRIEISDCFQMTSAMIDPPVRIVPVVPFVWILVSGLSIHRRPPRSLGSDFHDSDIVIVIGV
jgi:hypothetical protein